MKNNIMLLLAAVVGQVAFATTGAGFKADGNPIIRHVFSADPAPMVDGDTLWLFATHDHERPESHLKDWLLFSTTDMVNWVQHPAPMKLSDVKWDKSGRAYAAQAIKRNGKYYFYISTDGSGIGVGVSDKPEGPYKDPVGRPLVTSADCKGTSHYWACIDPTVFIDDDGQAWLFWGNGKCYAVRLKENMVETEGEVTEITFPGQVHEEAPWIHKHGCKYYLSYASHVPERIDYAMADNILGPYEYKGVLTQPTGNTTTIHQGIVEFKGKNYFFYHTGAIGGNDTRAICIEEFKYNPDGTINEIKQTRDGIGRYTGWQRVPGRICTPYGEKVTPENAYREYPRPQFRRHGEWKSLNGLWDYAIVGEDKDLDILSGDKFGPKEWDGKILVPYGVETSLSGVGRKPRAYDNIWYRRTVEYKTRKGYRTIINFDAVDYRSQVYLNGVEILDIPTSDAQHPFSVDITDFAKEGENELLVCVWDPHAEWENNRGKQDEHPGGCMYSTMSGIWQSVWVEEVPERRIVSHKFHPDVDGGKVRFDFETAPVKNAKVNVEVFFGGKKVAEGKGGENIKLPSPLKLWSPDEPNLYDVTFTLGKDRIDSYFGMRKIEVKPDANGIDRFWLNGKPVFLQGTLDQGWWPESYLTPPSVEAMKGEIQFLKDIGFNMMRKHLKTEPMVYYELCDRMGILVLQDMSTGVGDRVKRYRTYRQELKDMVDRLYNIPSIVMWMPYNEGYAQPNPKLTMDTYAWLKRYDPSRLRGCPSGWADYEPRIRDWHFLTHTMDAHIYPGPGMIPVAKGRVSFLGEFGGLAFRIPGHEWDEKMSWGYAMDGSREESFQRYSNLIRSLALLARKGLGGSVYTETSDVEGEINGLITYDRKIPKYDIAKMRELHTSVYRVFERAVKGEMESREIAPKKDLSPDAWKYCFDAPQGDWTSFGYDDGAWRKSGAGFSTAPISREARHPVSTRWDTKDIYLRRAFEYDGSNFELAWLEMFHDDQAEVWLNGVKVCVAEKFNGDYDIFALDPELVKKTLRKGRNVLAVHVHQDEGGQYIDLGLSIGK